MVNRKRYKTYFLFFLTLEYGCAPASVESRLNSLEIAVYANDRKLSDDLKKLHSQLSENNKFSYYLGQDLLKLRNVINEINSHLSGIEEKTDKFCIYLSDDHQTLELLPEGECSKLQ